ncbi:MULTISPECIES: dTDP-4-amino-4,6-dideoxy-D-glucose aminotransferase VioA [Aeromonas]|uniref:dTDP-4-amino-4,6-dideoxy-D-glucose aminotransferase VioA n=1 Tax=Aeromonas hydrophila TaxID=644 RepID=UPI0005D73F41|nr:dTDP-4-amino-4,6-dideoxy-D-glucose aminotransferase VioA [Aeromonas hydrophila]ELM3749671.1 dTDP-4-amino-4,6-dideoxy-D-glucose aminotransferase VioA [Aeromonas dhakensis]HEB5077521.1 dTDP-4-amino-4,6-dideoxy-D-glucose aminotransferase VioA [Aeromonas hydrophila subsp. hydrophila]AKA16679.1 aminotransferase [Aeromonas hydrophila]ELM3753262.1 dTDP-4-amino-4,6-dideoxy-D-glucose aminotransferase VioA [Aeromonas dhakensis]QGZ72372.1 DegT/DnrJ/EryC1/StrS family aminotransferase [Aeromonas hydroph
MKKNIPVTQPFLPELKEFIPYLEKIWDNRWLTNNGPFHQELEVRLAEYLGVEHVSLFNNATIALITALQAMRINGEVITTPYSFVATSHSIMWNGLEPVFVDIDPTTFNIDPEKIEAAITPRTTAIMPVHCYSNPCDVEAIQKIADNYGLKVIYDAAHAFGIKYKGQSILNWGDLSILSFHATKVFNTFEGGAIISPDAKTKQRIDRLKNFGIADELTVTAPGINGKMSEINAAFGLVQLKHIDQAMQSRQIIDERYRTALRDVPGITMYKHNPYANSNFSYFPILVDNDYKLSRDELYEKLKDNNILSRRYFYPLISNMPMYRGLVSSNAKNLEHANVVSDKVLCLPIFDTLKLEDQLNIIKLINEA